MIKVGCQEHSLKHWKKNYQRIANANAFPKDSIPEYLKHLKTIENSLHTTNIAKPKQPRNSLGRFCKKEI